MFKTKEELINKYTFPDFNVPEVVSYDAGIKDAFESFAERVEFYKKYKLNTGLITEELKNEFKSNGNGRKWNDWLFDYCFGDVIE